MTFLLTTIFFVFGLIIGSFLNVVIFRFNTRRSFGGRSGCLSCQSLLSWYELIPVVSFLGLKGRCRSCKTKISIQYPIVELLSGIIFGALFLKFQYFFFWNTLVFSFSYAYYATFFSLLTVVAFYDLRHKIIPDVFSVALGILSFVGLFFFSNYTFYLHFPTLFEFFSGPLIALPLFLFWLLSSGSWMGLGDAKLVISLGWLLGFSVALSGVVVAFWIGAAAGLFLVIFLRRYGMKSEIPFAPYLILGAFLAFIFELHLFGF